MIFWLAVVVVGPILLVAILLKLQNHFEWPWLEALLVKFDEISTRRRGFRLPIVEILFIPLILFLIWGAFRSEGHEWVPFSNTIAVLADSTDWARLEPVVRDAFEPIVRTPQYEKAFHLVQPRDLEMRKSRNYRYWLLLTTLESEGPVHDIVMNEVLPGNAADMVLRDDQKAYVSGSPWGFDQLLMTLVARNTDELSSFIEAEKDSLFDVIDADAHMVLRKELFNPRSADALTRELMDSTGFTFTHLGTMSVEHGDHDKGFVGLVGHAAGSWMFVHWVDGDVSGAPTRQWVAETRDRLTCQYYDSSYVNFKYLKSRPVRFLGRDALISRGLWAMDKPSCGGPFTNYVFYDKASNRTYMIDVSVYAAGKDKMPYLQPLEVMVHTFMTQQEFHGRSVN